VRDVMGEETGVPKWFDALGAHGYEVGLMSKLARDNRLACLERTWGGS